MRKSWPSSAVFRRTGLAAAVLLGAATIGVTGAASAALGSASRPAATGPTIRLLTSQRTIEVALFPKSEVYIDPGFWVASLGSPFQIDVSRASYTSKIRAAEIIRTAHGTISRRLPWWVPQDWNGLRHFFNVTITKTDGKVVSRSVQTFCPDSSYEVAKATPNAAITSGYPEQCNSFDPFPLGEVWGIASGWAVDPGGTGYKLPAGTYRLTESIALRYVKLFHISSRDSKATVTVKVVSYKNCCGPTGCCPLSEGKHAAVPAPAHFVRVSPRPSAPRQSHSASSLARQPDVKVLKSVPAAALPDLIPLPSWGISVANSKGVVGKKKTPKYTSFLDFGATVWIGGNAPLDVEGFRTAGRSVMQAYQYFWLHGKVIGRMHVGTMGFASYNAWHFKQFAQYVLLNRHKKVVVRSNKIGFCIAPSDSVDMLLPHATWVPSYTGIQGNCGDPSAIWVSELMPLGWGDTYFQSVPYQSFDISKIPNGTYYIEIIANPEHLLHETTSANDISLRKVILGGTKTHRTVRVPAWHGIDPENGTTPYF
jgi:hypothetical protein